MILQPTGLRHRRLLGSQQPQRLRPWLDLASLMILRETAGAGVGRGFFYRFEGGGVKAALNGATN